MHRAFFAALATLAITIPPAMAADLTIGAFAKKYPSAFADVDLTIPKGTVMTLVGPSGSGKTTTMRCIGRFLEPGRGAAVMTSPGRGTAIFNFAAKDIFVDDQGTMRSLRNEMKKSGGQMAANTGSDTGKKDWMGDKEVDALINRMPAVMRGSIAERMKPMPRAQQLQMLKILGKQVGMAQEGSSADGVATGKTKAAGKGNWPSELIKFEDSDVYVTDPANVPNGTAALACLGAISDLHGDVVQGFGMNHAIFHVAKHGVPAHIISKNGEELILDGIESRKID